MSLVCRREVTLEWGDCDPADIAFYPNYFRWFDAGTHHLFRMAGLDLGALGRGEPAVIVPLLGAEAKFLRPSRYGETIVVESRVESWERKTFRVGHRAFNGGELAVEGVETRCWTTRGADGRLKGTEVPEEVRRRFEQGVE